MGRSSRSWHSILDLLPPEQQAAYRQIKGYPPDYTPPPEEWQEREIAGIEGRDELERIMPLPPGFESVADWRRATRGRRRRSPGQ